MPRDSRAAGRRFEQRLARDIRAVLPDAVVSRVPSDRQAGQTGQAGDIEVQWPGWRWCLEAKDGAGFRLEHLFAQRVPGPLASTPSKEGMWAQAKRQAASVDRLPLLVVRESGSRTVLVIARTLPCRVAAFVSVDGEELQVGRWSSFLAAVA